MTKAELDKICKYLKNLKGWDWNHLEDSPYWTKVLSPEQVAEFRKWVENNMVIS